MPMNHMAIPSETGPRPPRPQPPGDGVSLVALMKAMMSFFSSAES